MGKLKIYTKNNLEIENRAAPFFQNNGFKKITQLSGWRLELIHHYVKEILKKKGNKKLNPQEKEIYFNIGEESGIRLTLLFKSISNLLKNKKIEHLLSNIRAMSLEEVYYWYAKISDPLLNGRGLKAFRILMSE